MPSKIKIRAASWHVYADTGEEYPPYLGLIYRLAYQEPFFVATVRRAQQQPPTFATFTEAVDYIRRVSA